MKTRNFFLAIFGFLALGVLAYIAMEIHLSIRRLPPPLVQAPPTHPPGPNPPTHTGEPAWLLPLDMIEDVCESPWVFPRILIELDHTLGELAAAGLSGCYTTAGDHGAASHLWHQGVGREGVKVPVQDDQQLTGSDIELYFDHDADFHDLGLESPETVSLSGTVVHDLNGDAVFNPGEPPISGAHVCLNREPLAPVCDQSGPEGDYHFRQLIPGVWRFQIRGSDTGKLVEFRYTNQLVDQDHHYPETKIDGYTIAPRVLNLTEFNPIEVDILVLVDRDRVQDFFLMHEWATYFASPQDIHLFDIQAHFDQDLHPGTTRIYNGQPGPTYDQHDGLDARCPKGTEILSVAEGRVIAIFDNSTVAIRHPNKLITIYGHGQPLVIEDQYVPRGYPVTRCDEILTDSGPHIHFAVWMNNPWLPKVIYTIPAFADLVVSARIWEVNRHPLDPDHYVYALQGGRGVWTEINNPHPPYVRLLGE